jgi:nicotinate dehydrogenase subunit B
MSVSRREFLKSSGALVVGFSATPAALRAMGQGPFDTHVSHVDPTKLDSWIAVATDGTATAYTGKCDFGQGMFTVQTQLVAEELCLPISRVHLIQCDTSVAPDQGTTSGSQSTPTNFNSQNLAQAAATAREALIGMAARKWNEPADRLTVDAGVISGKPGRRITYGELIGGKRFDLPLNPDAKRKTPDQWTVLGKPVPSLDRVALMTGQFEFVHNVRVPEMLHGRVVRPPDAGATVAHVDEDSVRQAPGFVKVVVRKNFVGVVAEKQWQAMQAARQLKVTWNRGSGLPAQASFYENISKQAARDTVIVDSQNIESQLSAADSTIRATYTYPYQMHGSVGTSCAVADVQADRATIWSATQSVYPTRSIAAKLLEMPLDNIRVVYVRGSGCYGLNGADTVSFDAAVLSLAVGKPVRVQLSRQDEMAWENYGSACVVEQRAGVDRHGRIVAWDCETWNASLGGRPGYDRPGNVITGLLLGFDPERISPGATQEKSRELRNRSNAAPSYIAGCIGDKCAGAGTIRSERVISHTVPSHFFTGPLRSPLRIQNTFAHECFMDEICAQAGLDPIETRLQHLSEKRIIDCLKAVAETGRWEKRASPKVNKAPIGIATGRGVACVAYEGNNGYTALIAEVEVDLATGQVHATRFVVAVDCGPISNPDGLRNQIEGGILQGMSRALVEEVTWDDQRVTSVDWETYQNLYLGINVPPIEIVLMNPRGVAAIGAGETAITVVPAAIGNAIFDATGVRLRQVPFTPERFKAAHAANLHAEEQRVSVSAAS